ncbi:hypothetical protein EBI_26817 [Enterocytozoon bieneusi H348]|nr:hypothetical protein EBI_26817 [Enterocytozoon bieneusi H348]|eukprot:XP_002650543.1 hypothetical protein EBI_26817 [Enterocytozoon bieneusi H348]
MPTYQQILIVIGNKLHGQIEMSTRHFTENIPCPNLANEKPQKAKIPLGGEK